MTQPDVLPLIRERAYQLWEAKGCPAGQDLDLWLEAEAAVSKELQATEAAAPAAKPKRRKVAAAAEPEVIEAAPAAKPAAKPRKPKAAGKA
ncbi:MAG: DUF2934 domain-containing protein [Geminicoccaceae bacterium]